MITNPLDSSIARKMQVRALISEVEIAEIAKEWKSLQNHPNVQWEFYWHINRTFRHSPCVLELRMDGEIRSLWVGRFERSTVPLKMGYLKLAALEVHHLNIITGGIMGDQSSEACTLMLQGARELLVQRKLDILLLSYLPRDHPLFFLAQSSFPGFFRDWSVIPCIHWKMSLPKAFQMVLEKRGKKHRSLLNRLPRLIEEAYPGQIRIRRFREPRDVCDFCRDASTVAESTYQYQLGEAFRNDDNHHQRCHLLARLGLLRGYIIYVADKPKAYWMATVCGDTIHLNLTGYDPEFKKFQLGTVLLMKLFEDHCGTDVKCVDFGPGGAIYKERFGDESLYEASVRIYRRTPRGLLANALTAFNETLASAVTTSLAKLGLLQKIKTLWRSKLSGKQAGSAERVK